jgi:hypothetical protein
MKCAVLCALDFARSARYSTSSLLDLTVIVRMGYKWYASLVYVSFPAVLAGIIALLVVLAVFSRRATEE